MVFRRTTKRDPHGGRREAAVYGRGQTYVVESQQRFGYGPSYRSPPNFVVDRVAADAELGGAIVKAVESFRYLDHEPSQADLDAANRELFAVVGVKGDATFARNASLVEVDERGGHWVVQPWDRRRGMWTPLNEETYLRLTDPTTQELGAAVRKAFVKASGVP